jgi:hypothetical protein
MHRQQNIDIHVVEQRNIVKTEQLLSEFDIGDFVVRCAFFAVVQKTGLLFIALDLESMQGQIQGNNPLVTTNVYNIDSFAVYGIKNELQILGGAIGVVGNLVRHAKPLNKVVEVFDALKTVKISKQIIQSN